MKVLKEGIPQAKPAPREFIGECDICKSVISFGEMDSLSSIIDRREPFWGRSYDVRIFRCPMPNCRGHIETNY